MNFSKYRILFTVPLIVFLADQATKLWIERVLPVGRSIPVIPHLFDIIHTTNRGAAFGTFAGLPDNLRIPFFFFSSLLALAVVIGYFVKLKPERRGPFISLALILGGALGNIFDRVIRGEVVDFLSFHWYDRWADIEIGSFYWRFKLEWPAFNVADAAITVSVLWLMATTLGAKKSS